MRVVINQPNYIPWRGYFDMIASCDLFIFYDDVAYTTRDWRNRNQIKTRQGLAWLTVPVCKAPRGTLIKDILIDHTQDWITTHKRQIIDAYRPAPFFKNYADGIFDILDRRHAKLVDLDVDLTHYVMQALGITTPTRRASSLAVTGAKPERLLALLRAACATEYLSGPAARDYIDVDSFQRSNIRLLWKAYDYAPYPQQWQDFEPSVTVLDLLFNCGPDAAHHLQSRQADTDG